MAKNMKGKYGPKERASMEDNEGLQTVKSDLPADRLDANSQVQTNKTTVTPAPTHGASGSGNTEPEIAASVVHAVHDKVKLRPNSGTELKEAKDVGGIGIPEQASRLLGSAAGVGNARAVVDDRSRKPYTGGGYRPQSAAGKVTSDVDFIINNAICEQLAPAFDGIKDLRHADDDLMFYNGQKQFTTARGKKNAGNAPQATLFDRSVDYVLMDRTIHTTGQVLDSITPDAGYPTKTYVGEDEDGADSLGYASIPAADQMPKSNYVLKSFTFTLTNGRLSAVSFNEDKMEAHVHAGRANEANLNWQVDNNNVTQSVIRMQKELGRETTEKWSPLGYVIEQPYEYNMLVHDIEATTGAIMMTAYRANISALAFRSNNILAKDGAKPVDPIIEMFLDGIGQVSQSMSWHEMDGFNLDHFVFGESFCRAGSASAIIKMFDSTSKYSTKANFFNLPRSLKYFIQTMDNNLDTLYAKENFLKALDTAHVFSTPDGNYNPMLPIYATDKISLVNPLSLNHFLKGWSRDNVSSDNPAGTTAQFKYNYSDIRNHYEWEIKHPIVDGLLAWMLKHEANLVKAYGANATVTLPAFFSMLAPSMFQCMLAAASYDIAYRRQVIMRDWLFAGDQTEYVFPDLSSMKSLNPLFSSNLTITDFKSPLKLGKMKAASFVQIFWGDTYTVAGSDDPAVGYKKAAIFQPWYFNEVAFDTTYRLEFGFVRNDEARAYSMSYPEVRVGVCHEYIDYLFSMPARDLRLSLDRALDIAVPVSSASETSWTKYALTASATNINNNIKLAAIRYDSNSDGRVIVNYTNEDYIPTKASIMCLARELGFIYPIMRVSPIITGITIDENGYFAGMTTTGNYRMSSKIDGSNGFSLRSYKALGRNIDSKAVSRTAALQQDFYSYFADRSAIEVNGQYLVNIGVIPSITCCFNAGATVATVTTRTDVTEMSPFKHVNSDTAFTDLVGTTSLLSLARYEWSKANRVFFPVDVFGNSLATVGAKPDEIPGPGSLVDPLEPCFEYGLTGFFAADYSQDVLQRADQYDQLNINYTEDVFIKSSLIFR